MNANVKFLHRSTDIRHARLSGWSVDVAANRVQRDGVDIRLTPKAMGVLRELMQRRGTVVRRDDLLGIVWGDGFPTDDVLTHAVTELRRALELDPRAPKIIETIPKVGYRLIGALEIVGEPEAGAPAPALVPVQALDAGASAQAPARAPTALALVLLLLAAFAVVMPLSLRERVVERASAARVANATAVPHAPDALQPVALTSDPSREQFPTLSPDGSTVAYTALDGVGGNSRIMIKPVEPSASSIALTDPRPPIRDDYPVWSPDGKQVAFLRFDASDDCAIHIVPALGGQARKVGTCSPRTIDYFDWSADGRSLLVARRQRLADGTAIPAMIHRLDIESGTSTPIEYAPRPVGSDDLQPKSSPDGRYIAFRRGAVPYSDIYVMPVEGGTAQRVTALASRLRGFAWDSDSAHVVFSSDQAGRQTLYRSALDGGRLEDLGVYEAHFPTVARNAPVLVYMQESELMQLAQLGIEDGKAGARTPVVPSSRSDWFPTLSPSNKRLAFVSMRTGSQQLWVHEFESGATFPVTRLDKTGVGFPQWSPDESAVLFVTRANGRSTLMRADLATARAERVSLPDERVRFGSYAKDGRWIYFSSDRSGTWQVWRMAPDGTGAEQLGSNGGFDPRDADGDGAIYYVKETSPGLYRLDLDSREEKRVSWVGGYWNMDTLLVRDGKLYFLDYNRESATWLMQAPLHLEGLPDYAPTAALTSISAATRNMDMTPFVQLDVARPAAEASIASDLSRVVVITIARDETDLMTARLEPAR